MTYYNFFTNNNHQTWSLDIKHILKGVFISSSYESNKIKCNEAYLDNFLYTEDMSLETTIGRIKAILGSFMLPIKDIERNLVGLCNIKCEDFNAKVEITNTGPHSFHLSEDVYILPPIPCDNTDLDVLKMNISNKVYLKPIIVPKHEIINIYEDMYNLQHCTEDYCFSSLLYKAYKDEIHDDLFRLLLSGYDFNPIGYVVSKSSHEPPSVNAVTIKPNEKCIIVISKPMSTLSFASSRFFAELAST